MGHQAFLRQLRLPPGEGDELACLWDVTALIGRLEAIFTEFSRSRSQG